MTHRAVAINQYTKLLLSDNLRREPIVFLGECGKHKRAFFNYLMKADCALERNVVLLDGESLQLSGLPLFVDEEDNKNIYLLMFNEIFKLVTAQSLYDENYSSTEFYFHSLIRVILLNPKVKLGDILLFCTQESFRDGLVAQAENSADRARWKGLGDTYSKDESEKQLKIIYSLFHPILSSEKMVNLFDEDVKNPEITFRTFKQVPAINLNDSVMPASIVDQVRAKLIFLSIYCNYLHSLITRGNSNSMALYIWRGELFWCNLLQDLLSQSRKLKLSPVVSFEMIPDDALRSQPIEFFKYIQTKIITKPEANQAHDFSEILKDKITVEEMREISEQQCYLSTLDQSNEEINILLDLKGIEDESF